MLVLAHLKGSSPLGGGFDPASGWVASDPSGSRYNLTLIDWSKPSVWIEGDQASLIATKNLSMTTADNPEEAWKGYAFDTYDPDNSKYGTNLLVRLG